MLTLALFILCWFGAGIGVALIFWIIKWILDEPPQSLRDEVDRGL